MYYKCILIQIKHLLKVFLVEPVLETFILVIMESSTKKSLKEFDVLKNKDKDFFCSDYCNVRFQMIKDSVGKFDDYLISPKIRQILLH